MVRFKTRFGPLAITGVILLLSACGAGSGSGGNSGPGGGGLDGGGSGGGGSGAGSSTGNRTADSIIVPSTFEAEDFDIGGDYVGYHDATLGNQGGEYRLGEDVDIILSGDPEESGYDVDFEAGEWLAYTLEATETTDYDIALRAANAGTDGAFRIEVDDADATGSISVPSAASADGYVWINAARISLTTGPHLLKVHADRQRFRLNAVRVAVVPKETPTEYGNLLFESGFEGAVALGVPLIFGNGAWQDIVGLDSATGQLWPPLLWGGSSARFQLLPNEPTTFLTLGNYMHNALQTVTGRNGSGTRALYMHVQQSIGGADENWNGTQDSFQIYPGPGAQGDLYLSYWLKLQPDLVERMTANNWSGRVVSDWKTGIGTGGGDYRVVFSIFGDGANGRLYWHVKGDNVANGGLPVQIFWEQTNSAAPVPVGRWFRVEVFVHRSGGNDGRIWFAVDGQQVFDRYGPNMGVNNLPWNRIMPFLNYSTGQQLPAYQWVDDLEIWDGFPSTASPR